MPTKTTRSKTGSSTKRKKSASRTGLLNQGIAVRRSWMSFTGLAFVALFVVVGVYIYQATHAATQAQVEAFSPTSGECLAGGQSPSGSTVYVAGCNGSPGENWQMTAQTINNPTDHTCLQMGGIPNPDKNAVISVVAKACNGSAAQSWVQTNGYEMINQAGLNVGKNKCLVDPNSGVSPGNILGAVGCSTAKPQDQLWFNGTFNAQKPPPKSPTPAPPKGGISVVCVGTPGPTKCDEAGVAVSHLGYSGHNIQTQVTCASNIFTRESGWNPLIMNPAGKGNGNGAFGIAQALGHGTNATAAHGVRVQFPGGSVETLTVKAYPNEAANAGNANDQIVWGINYMASAYGSPCGAWNYWQGHHAYIVPNDGRNVSATD